MQRIGEYYVVGGYFTHIILSTITSAIMVLQGVSLRYDGKQNSGSMNSNSNVETHSRLYNEQETEVICH